MLDRLNKQIEKHGIDKVCEYLNVTKRHMKENLLTGKSKVNIIKLRAIENIA